MTAQRIEFVDKNTLRVRGSVAALRPAQAPAPSRNRIERTASDAAGQGAAAPEWSNSPVLADCLIPALRVLSHQVEKLESELEAVRNERDAERSRVAMLVQALEDAKNGGDNGAANPEPAAEPKPAVPAGDLAAAFPRLSMRQKQVLDLIAQGKCTKDIARALNLGVGTVKVHMSALYSALGVSSRSAALATSYHHLAKLGHAHEARDGVSA